MILSSKQYYLENPTSKEVYVADISDDCYIVGIYGPLHHTGIRAEYLGKYGTNAEDAKWAMQKSWTFLKGR